MKKTKIVATIGPESSSKEILRKLILSGVNVIRLNLTHASHDFCKDILEKVRQINEEEGTTVASLLDTNGPDIRTGSFIGGYAFLKKGDKIRIYMDDIMGDNTKFSINYNIIEDIKIGSIIKINDGLVILRVYSKGLNYLICEVLEEGNVYNHKSVNLPGTTLNRCFLSKKDINDIEFATECNFDFIALSFVSTAEDVLDVSDMLIEAGNNHTQIISKIECQNALDELDNIIRVSDGIMVARGDLGVEIPMEKVPSMQKKIINLCHNYGKICIVATEMLSTMEETCRPTRAEVSDVYNAVIDGADAVMLSGETTIGKYPVETVSIMEKILNEAESSIDYSNFFNKALDTEEDDIAGLIAFNVAESAFKLSCKAIITPTMSGLTAKKISRYRPNCPIIAVSPDPDTVKSLMLNFGVIPLLIDDLNSLDKIIAKSTEEAKKILNLCEGDRVVITGGYPFKDSKYTNFMKIEEL